MNLNDYRADLILAATRSVERWCVHPDEMVDGRRHPDTYWMLLFGGLGQRPVNAEDAHRFLVTFMLTNRVRWDTQMVADVITELQYKPDFVSKHDVPAMSLRLTEANARHTQQTSAASKIATFAKPNATTYIWDKLASKSARDRDWRRGNYEGRARINAQFTNEGRHDYPAFYDACERAMSDERQCPDFTVARDELIQRFRGGNGPMADPELVSDSFIERRLLDKLMFAEGWVIDRQLPPPPGWIDGAGM